MGLRCYDRKCKAYRNYGGRGIKVCDRWRRSFAAFLADMGPRPTGMTLDRYPNNDGDYEPGNCRWATPAQQAENTRQLRRLTHNGLTHSLSWWSRHLGVSRQTLHKRLLDGWSVERALTTPLVIPGRKRKA